MLRIGSRCAEDGMSDDVPKDNDEVRSLNESRIRLQAHVLILIFLS